MDCEFWTRWKSPKFVLAPMVDASELPWRLLSRKYGAQLCYSPMIHSGLFVKDSKYRQEYLFECADDRPLIIQFCGNDPVVLQKAALLAENHCDAIDLNLGCPQAIAKRGFYGAFLQNEWNLLSEIIKTLRSKLSVPITCKIRVFKDVNRTVQYAKMLENAGCQLLTVHGRTKDQKGRSTSLADWTQIRAVKNAVKIPVIANGNIQYFTDIERCLLETNADAIMSAEGNLYNPAIFSNQLLPVWVPALQYLDLVLKYKCQLCCTRGHLFKLYHSLLALSENSEQREKLASGTDLSDFIDVTIHLKEKYEKYHSGDQIWTSYINEANSCNLYLPPWICQPYKRTMDETKKAKDPSEEFCDENGMKISKNKFKKLKKMQKRPTHLNVCKKRRLETCKTCGNPLGYKCLFELCKVCCRAKCFSDNEDCVGHGILVKTRREFAKQFQIENI